MTRNIMFVVVGRCPPKGKEKLVSATLDQTHIRYCHYGHLSWNGLKVIQQKKLVDGLP